MPARRPRSRATPEAGAPPAAAGAWRFAPAGFVLALLAVVAVRYAEPVSDNDLFWHMAYARRMLAQGSLVVDHTIFSWTPASNAIIYCAWLAELIFYALWERLGASGLFALRYLVVLAVLALAWTYARRVGLVRSPLAYLVLMVLALASVVGTLLKPELFSFLCINLVVWAFFRARLAVADQRNPLPWLYAVPAVVLVWVNTHGGVIVASVFLAATALGEAANQKLSPRLAMPWRAYRHLLVAWALAALATALTPYGIRYPLQLVSDYALGATARPDVGWNAAHQPIWASGTAAFHFVDLLAVMVLTLASLMIAAARIGPSGGRVDWTLVLANLVCVPLYVVYARSTYFWPPVFAYSAFWLLRALGSVPAARLPWAGRPRLRQALTETIVAVFLFLGGRACYEAWARPVQQSWLGFGVSYWSPVVEAEFLARHQLGPRLYNVFNSGGYPLWRLDPAYKVMVDSRSFPYLGWFDDQYRFETGQEFRSFLDKYPGDVAAIDLAKPALVDNFLAAPDWRLAFYGPTAAVFVKRGVELPPGAREFAPGRFLGLRNAGTAVTLFDFATRVDDFATAWTVLDQLEGRLRHQIDARSLRTRVAYREAYRALAAGDIARGRALLAEGLDGRTPGPRDRLVRAALDRLRALPPGSPEAVSVDAEIRALAARS